MDRHDVDRAGFVAGRLRAGTLFGELGVLHSCPRSAFVFAETYVEIYTLSADEFLTRMPPITLKWTTDYCEKIYATQHIMKQQQKKQQQEKAPKVQREKKVEDTPLSKILKFIFSGL